MCNAKGDVTRDDSQRRFLAQHSVVTLFRMVTTVFQHCNAGLRLKLSLRIVACDIIFKQQRRGRLRKRHLNSEVALLQTLGTDH